MVTRWMVILRVETDPVEVYPYETREEAEAFYERMALQWSDVSLVKVVRSVDVEEAERNGGKMSDQEGCDHHYEADGVRYVISDYPMPGTGAKAVRYGRFYRWNGTVRA